MNPEEVYANIENNEGLVFDALDGRYKMIGQTDSKCPTWIDLPILSDLEEKKKYDL
jgi:hypothetical protein